MTKNILTKFLTAMLLITSIVLSQDEQDVDAIEKARQAKEAAEKAAAEASAATEAAIEAAAQKAAKEAREDAKRKKEEEEARKLAEAKAAEEAELDAAATAAAEEAKRKMAEELGLEYESPETGETGTADTTALDGNSEEFVAKEPLGFNLGLAASVGLLSGNSFTSIPVGATLVITTPLGFKVGPLDYTVSLALGGYTGKYDSEEDSDYELPNGAEHFVNDFNPTLLALGGNLTLAKFLFAEGHIGLVGEGTGFRGFAGVTLERLMKKGLNLPFNLLVGSEAFYSSDIAGVGNSSGWASLGVRLDYNF